MLTYEHMHKQINAHIITETDTAYKQSMIIVIVSKYY